MPKTAKRSSTGSKKRFHPYNEGIKKQPRPRTPPRNHKKSLSNKGTRNHKKSLSNWGKSLLQTVFLPEIDHKKKLL